MTKSLTTSPYSIAGYVPAVFMPVWFIGQQIALTEPIRVSDNDQLVAQQLGNCYGLACLVALAVLYTSTEIQVVRNYLKALWIADIGHLVLTFYALGYDRSISIHTWNAMTWGNIGATVSSKLMLLVLCPFSAQY